MLFFLIFLGTACLLGLIAVLDHLASRRHHDRVFRPLRKALQLDLEGHPQQSLDAFTQALAAKPPSSVVGMIHRHMASCLGQLGQYAAAAESLRVADALCTSLAQRMANAHARAFLALRTGDLDSVLPLLDAHPAFTPEDLRVARMIRFTYHLLVGNFDHARAALDEPMSFSPATPQATLESYRLIDHAARAQLALHAHDPAAALALLDTTHFSGTSPKLSCLAAAFRAWALAALHRTDAPAAMTDALQRLNVLSEPARAETYATLARAAACAGDHPHAIALWTKVLQIDPSPVHAASAHYYLAESHRARGHSDDAFASYQKVISLNLPVAELPLARTRLADLT